MGNARPMSDDERFDAFMDLSNILTGVAINSLRRGGAKPDRPAKAGDLMPRNTPIDLATLYLNALNTGITKPEVVTRLFRSYLEQRTRP